MTRTASAAQHKLIAAAFKLAAAHDWNQFSLEQIAKTAKVPAAHAMKIFINKDAVLAAMIAHIDEAVTDAIGKTLTKGSPHDRLFEVLMARFDILQTYRPAILHIIASVKRNPAQARALIVAQTKAMQQMLTLSGLRQNGVMDLLARYGLMAIYAATLCVWERDESKDMTKTMAILDKHLRRSGRIMEMLDAALKRVS